MKILTISVNENGHGAYARQRRMADALVNSGHEVFWLAPNITCPSKETFLQVEDIKWPLPNPILWQIKLYFSLKKYSKIVEEIDVVFTVRE